MSKPTADTNYRALYGKLFSSLTNQFGIRYATEIEDAIQNSFFKSIKNWKLDSTPEKKEDWLYITARNDLVNQLKRSNKSVSMSEDQSTHSQRQEENDLRLQAILLVASAQSISKQGKVIFVLKTIFGLNVREISESTLLGNEAIYKMISRAKTSLQSEFKGQEANLADKKASFEEITVVNEILYAVFNVGFDSFSEKNQSIVNEDLCLESLSLSRLLYKQSEHTSTSNLLALFSFHVARIPAKVYEGKLVSFFNQDREKWNQELIRLGFHQLQKPEQVDKFYIEALIVSKYLATAVFDTAFWNDIIKLYEILLRLAPSPIVELNYCFCLHKADRKKEAMEVFEKVEAQLPAEHIYLSLLKAQLLKETDPKESEKITSTVLTKMNQDIRKTYLTDNEFFNL